MEELVRQAKGQQVVSRSSSEFCLSPVTEVTGLEVEFIVSF